MLLHRLDRRVVSAGELQRFFEAGESRLVIAALAQDSREHAAGLAVQLLGAAHLLEVSEEDIEWELGRFYLRGDPDRGVSIQECAMAAYSNLPDGSKMGKMSDS